MSEFDVLVLGGVGVDTIVHVPELEFPPGDGVLVPPVHDYVAHSGNGVALGFHGLALRTKFLDFLGEDSLGAFVLARYAEAGLDFGYLPAENGTPRSVNLVDSHGRRFSFFDGRHPADAELPAEFYLPILEQSRHVHVAGRAFGAFAHAQRLGVSTSTDIHAWDGEDEALRRHALEADLVFLSSARAPERIDEIMLGILEHGRARVVAATEGEHGSRVLTRADPRIRRFPIAPPENPVVDSNGAGDGYSTAFMSRWFAGRPVEECALAGAVSGAFACTVHGTCEEQIGEEQLTAAMKRAAATAPWQAVIG